MEESMTNMRLAYKRYIKYDSNIKINKNKQAMMRNYNFIIKIIEAYSPIFSNKYQVYTI